MILMHNIFVLPNVVLDLSLDLEIGFLNLLSQALEC